MQLNSEMVKKTATVLMKKFIPPQKNLAGGFTSGVATLQFCAVAQQFCSKHLGSLVIPAVFNFCFQPRAS